MGRDVIEGVWKCVRGGRGVGRKEGGVGQSEGGGRP